MFMVVECVSVFMVVECVSCSWLLVAIAANCQEWILKGFKSSVSTSPAGHVQPHASAFCGCLIACRRLLTRECLVNCWIWPCRTHDSEDLAKSMVARKGMVEEEGEE